MRELIMIFTGCLFIFIPVGIILEECLISEIDLIDYEFKALLRNGPGDRESILKACDTANKRIGYIRRIG